MKNKIDFKLTYDFFKKEFNNLNNGYYDSLSNGGKSDKTIEIYLNHISIALLALEKQIKQ